MNSARLLRTIARGECVLAWRDGRAPVAMVALIGLSIWLGAVAFQAGRVEATDREAFNAGERARWLAQGPTTPHDAGHHGLLLARPLPTLAWIETGVEEVAGRLARLEVHERTSLVAPAADERILSQRVARPGLGAFLRVVVPLLLLALVTPAVAASREDGVLRDVVAAGVSPRLWAGGTLIGGTAVAGGTLVALWAVGYGMVAIYGAPTGERQRVVVLALAYTLYWLGWLLAGLIISLRASTAARAAVVATCLWAWCTLVGPPVFNALVEALAPAPSVATLAAEGTRLRANLPNLYTRIEALQRDSSWRHAGYRNPKGVALIQEEEAGQAIDDRLAAQLYDAQDRQRTALAWLGLLAPGLAMESLAQAITGTDSHSVRQHLEEAEQHRRRLLLTLNEAEARHGDPDAAPFEPSYLSDARIWSQVPDFHPSRRPLRESLSDVSPSTVVIVVWVAALGAGCWCFAAVGSVRT